jgi:spore maturation protein CgeB
MAHKILIAGETGNHCLEMAYYNAFLALGHEVRLFNTKTAVMKYARPLRWAYHLHRFVPIDSWIRKANKDLTTSVRDFQPDLLVVFTGAEILPGTFAYLKSILPLKIFWYWADPLPNLSRYIHNSLPLTDILLSYSKSSLKVFGQMGAPEMAWVPFAGDLSAHFEPAVEKKESEYVYDISFIGSWKPEREWVLKQVHQLFPDLKIFISGPYWERCTSKPIRRLAVNKPLYGKDFSDKVGISFLNLNVMDDTNYPAVNMRFFEILASGGVELCSASPDMEDLFRDRKEVLYFRGVERLAEQIRYAIANRKEMEEMKIKAQGLLVSGHLYKHRAEVILKMAE